MVNRFILNEVSYFGPGARKELPGVAQRLGFKKALRARRGFCQPLEEDERNTG